MRKSQVVLLALLAIGLLTSPIAARAGTNLGMQVSSGGSSVLLCDNNIDFTSCIHNLLDANTTLGEIAFSNQNVGTWHLPSASGVGPPAFLLPLLLDITQISMQTVAGGAPLTLQLSVTGLTGPLGLVNFSNGIGGTNSAAGTTITISGLLSTTNALFCTSGCITALGPKVLTGATFADTETGSANTGAGPYSMTLNIVVDSKGATDTTSFDDQLSQFSSIPEPATLSVLGTGLLAIGTGLRRKFVKA